VKGNSAGNVEESPDGKVLGLSEGGNRFPQLARGFPSSCESTPEQSKDGEQLYSGRLLKIPIPTR
jgi:hypothetical protein